MSQSIERQIKRGHVKVVSIKTNKPPTIYYHPILGMQWLTHTSNMYVIKK